MFLNNTNLMGFLGSTPEIKPTTNGHKVVNVNLATTEYYKDSSGNKVEKTEWHSLVLWDRTAEIIAEYCKKGSHIHVTGKNQLQQWESKEGEKRSRTVIAVQRLVLLDKKQGQNGESVSGSASAPSNHPSMPDKDIPDMNDEFVEDDIPF